MKQATVKLPSGEYLIQEVPEIALPTRLFCNMGYLVYKAWDKSTFVTDEEILADGIRFLTTGKSKYSDATISDSIKDLAVKLPPGNWQLLGADPTNLTKEEAKEIVEHYSEKPKFVGDKSRTFYKDYRTGSLLIMIPTASLSSLAQSLGIEKPFVILRLKTDNNDRQD